MSQPTFQSGVVGSSGPVDATGVLGAPQVEGIQQIQAAQQQQQNDLAAITAQQEQAAQDEAKKKKDPSKGWSLNPFQDIGQIWHDVETHTVSPVFHATNWVATNLVKRPYTTIALYSGHNDYEFQHDPQHANGSWFQGSLWAQAWDQSAHISPGRATVLAANDQPVAWSPGHQFVDPMDSQARQDYLSDKKNPLHIGMQVASGGTDATIDWYGDPSNHLTKLGGVVRTLKNAPLLATSETVEQKVAKLNSASGAKFDQDVASGKLNFEALSEHPLVKGSSTAPNPLRYQAAALLAAAKTPQESNLIRQVMAGIPDARAIAQDGTIIENAATAGTVESSAKALDKLSDTNKDLAFQVTNAKAPLDLAQTWALNPAEEAEREDWFRRVSGMKTAAAQAQVDLDPETASRILDLFAQQKNITKTSALSDRIAMLRGNLKYRNTRDAPITHIVQNGLYNYPIRVYQSLTDRIPGLINHNEDNAVEYVRTWLNKSSSLTPDQKIQYTQKYANADKATRQRVWNDIENDVYKNVGDKYGLDSDSMNKILTTTRKRGQSIYMAARSRAYGEIKFNADDPQAVLPSTSEDIVTHAQLITQLESGAVPMASLKQLENALDRMQSTGILAPIRNAGAVAKDTLAYLLDNVYGVWKPVTLMTGHRVFNHVGDDYLRGVAKIGALASINNAAEGAGNFLRNNYARLTKNTVINNVMAKHDQAIGIAKTNYEGLLAIQKHQKDIGIDTIPEALRVNPDAIKAAKEHYDGLRKLQLDFIPKTHRLGEGTFMIPGSTQRWDEAMGGPNGDYIRFVTSSHPAFMSTIDSVADMSHSAMLANRANGFASIPGTDPRHTAAYVHYIRNQLLPDPVAKQLLAGKSMDSVARWMTSTSDGRNYMKALHVGDPDIKVNEVASMINKYLPYDGMRDAAVAGKFKASTIENFMPDAGHRPEINANIAALVHGGDMATSLFRRSVDKLMSITGTMPDDILVRHPLYNTLYKTRLTDNVQSWINDTGQKLIRKSDRDALIRAAHLGARKDLQNLVYDVSRFNDAGHTLRFISPFFNAWFNAMSTWSRLIVENPGLLGRAYQAKRALWNSPFAVNNKTGQQADVNTPWDDTSFVMHLPAGLAKSMGGLGDVPIDAKTLISPTYIDAIGNPGFGPLVTVPLNQIVKDHPALMNDAIVRDMLNNMVDKNSINQIMPSGARDIKDIISLMVGDPNDTKNYANTVWSIYQEQYYDYFNGQRTQPPNMEDAKNQAKYLTLVDLVANRLSPLGFKPAGSHSFLNDEYKRMLQEDPKNAQQNFYDKYGRAAFVYTQSLNTNKAGIPATVGASAAMKQYKDIVNKYPELAAMIIGPEGNGNFDQMAFDWQVAQGLRTKMTPDEAATAVNVRTGWAQYGQWLAYARAQLQAAGLTDMNDPRAKSIKAQITNFVAATGDPNSPWHNPDFYSDYGNYNQNDYQNRLQGLAQIAQNPGLLANPARSEIRSLNAYVQVRDQVYAALQKRPNKTLSAQSNSDLAQAYDKWVADRMNSDSKFAQVYDRYLRKDDWKEPLH